MARRLVLIAGALVAVLGVVLAAAWVTKDREFTASVPQPPPLQRVALLDLRGGQTACIEDITCDGQGG